MAADPNREAMRPIVERITKIWQQRTEAQRMTVLKRWLEDKSLPSFALFLRPDGSFCVEPKARPWVRGMRSGVVVLTVGGRDVAAVKSLRPDQQTVTSLIKMLCPSAEGVGTLLAATLWSGSFYAFYGDLLLVEFVTVHRFYRPRLGMVPSAELFKLCLRDALAKDLATHAFANGGKKSRNETYPVVSVS